MEEGLTLPPRALVALLDRGLSSALGQSGQRLAAATQRRGDISSLGLEDAVVPLLQTISLGGFMFDAT